MGIFRRLVPLDGGGEPAPFVFTVSVTSNQIFTLPLVNFGSFTPNIEVDWGDGQTNIITSTTDPNRIHTYSTAGTKTIQIIGQMPGFKVNNNSAIRLAITGIVDFGRVGIRTIDFFGCSNITSIPTDAVMKSSNSGNGIGYMGLNNVISFTSFMRGTGITSIMNNSDIFNYSTSATAFNDMFSFTSITQIPTGLFNNSVNATTFASAFNACTLLNSYPANLFNNSPNVVSFSSTFRNCLALTAVQEFTANTAVTTFDNVYNMSTTSNALDGNAPLIWTRSPIPSGTAAFRNCTGLDNFASIPLNFK
jgi:hypothetical protein